MLEIEVIRGYLALIALMVGSGAWGAETVTYSYDALGRVVNVTHAGGDNDGMANAITYDAAGNRTNYAVTGSKDRGLSSGAVVVVPLNGFTIIPIL